MDIKLVHLKNYAFACKKKYIYSASAIYKYSKHINLILKNWLAILKQSIYKDSEHRNIN